MARGNWALSDLPPYLAVLTLDIGSQGDLKSVGSDTMTITDGSYASPTTKRAGTASNNNTKTNEERFQLRLPSRRTTHGSADSGLEAIQGDIVVEVTARRTGTPATSMQLSMTAKESDKQGGVGAELVTTAAQDMLGVATRRTWAAPSSVVRPRTALPTCRIRRPAWLAIKATPGRSCARSARMPRCR